MCVHISVQSSTDCPEKLSSYRTPLPGQVWFLEVLASLYPGLLHTQSVTHSIFSHVCLLLRPDESVCFMLIHDVS